MELIPVQNLLFMLFPLAIVGYYYFKWTDNSTEVLYATIRMVTQLILIGYALVYIFKNDSWQLGFFIILFMIIMASFIALRNIEQKSVSTYFVILFAIAM